MAAQPLTNEEIENCRIAFAKFDKDGSGSISDYELKTMLQCKRESHRWPSPRAHSALLGRLDPAVVLSHP